MKSPVNLAGLFAILFALYLSSVVTADSLDSPVPDRLTLFGDPNHDDIKPTVGLMDSSDTEADKYELTCGKNGRYTTFCKNLPYQFYCNPDTGKGSVRVSNLLCGLVCSCKKIPTADTDFFLDKRSNLDAVVVDDQETSSTDLSALPQCAMELLPAIYQLKCPSGDWTACGCNNKSFIQDQCKLMRMQCSPEDAQVTIKFAQAVCGEVDAQIQCDNVPVSEREELTTNFLSARGSIDLHILEPRHNYAMVCDGSRLGASHQRLRTIDCQRKYGYTCTIAGRLSSRKDDTICTIQCRCVNTRPRCDKYLSYKGYSKDDTSWINCISTGLKKVAAEDPVAPESVPEVPQEDSAVATGQPDALEESLEKRAELTDAPIHQLERRHSYAFACDIDTDARDSRRLTRWCQILPRGYNFGPTGGVTFAHPNRWCNDHCRCATLNPRPIIPRPGMGIRVSIYGEAATSDAGDGSEIADTSESPGAEDIPDDINDNNSTSVKRNTGLESSSDSVDATTTPTMLCPGSSGLCELCKEFYYCTAFGLALSREDIPIEQCEKQCGCVDTRNGPPQRAKLVDRELGNPYISPPDPDPNMTPFKPWCSDADSVRDPLRTGNCIHLWKYTCNGLGELLTPKPREECELACVCVQEPKDFPPQLEARAEVSTENVMSPADVPKLQSDTEPLFSPRIVWYGDDNSMVDPLLTATCLRIWNYGCTDAGDIMRPTLVADCELLCTCAQETFYPPKDSLPSANSADDAMWAGLNQPPLGHLAELIVRDSFPDSMDTPIATADSERHPPKHHDITYDSPFSDSQWGDQDGTQDHPHRLEEDSPFSNSQWGNQEDGRADTGFVKPDGEDFERVASTLVKRVKAADPTDFIG